AVEEKQSIGTFSDIPVTIGIGNDTLTVSDEFSVLPTEKDSNVKSEFTASANGKSITIPLSVYNKDEEAN
ncbi:8972_t:CDS:2, partial [Dentiscutata erythropus]